MTDDYTPYRIMKSFVVPGPNEKYLMTHFPGGKIKRFGRKRGWQSIYEFKSIVNSPTPDEVRLFEASKHARLIPQDPGGFDVRDSNLARSIKSSVEGRRKHKIVVAQRKFAAEEAARIVKLEAKPKPAPKPLQKVVEVPELKIEPLPPIKTKSDKAVMEEKEIYPESTVMPKFIELGKKEPLPLIKTDSEGLASEEREDAGTGNPLTSGTEVKLETESETKQFKPKRKKRKYSKKSDSDPNKLDDESPIKTSKNEAGQKNNGGKLNG